MPKYICQVCKQKISYPKSDFKLHRKHYWECLTCYSVIAKQRYQVNIPNARTLFSPMGTALGDVCINEVIKRKYIEQNPDETVEFCDDINSFEDRLREFKPRKIFWSDLSVIDGDVIRKINMPSNAIWYSVVGEANAFIKQNFYSELPFKPEKPKGIGTFDIVLHLRNIQKCSDKNVSPGEASRILNILSDYKTVLVGNDSPIDDEILGDNIIDLRNKLSLAEIAWLMKRAKLYIGKDSGIAHLAGISNVSYLICWNYVSKKWFPKTRSDGEYFTNRDEFSDVLRAVKRFLLKLP